MSAPRWIVRLLAAVVDASSQHEVIGDLEELHRRRRGRWGAPAAAALTTAEGLWLVLVHAVRGALDKWRVGGRWLSAIELRLAWRMLWREPVTTLTAVVALGLGIGMAAGGISVFQQVLTSELPFEGGDRWTVVETYEERGGRRVPLDLERARLFRESATTLEYLGAYESRDFNVVHASGEVERISGARVSPATFRHLPYAPVLGRLLGPADGGEAAEPVVLVRESLWTRRFGRSAEVLGASLDVGGARHRVVGVLADEARYPSEGELWLPLDERTLGAASERGPVAGSRSVAILVEGATIPEATAELQRLSDRVSAPGRGVEARRHRITPVTETIASPQTYYGSVLASTILIAVLLVIASNVANLIVARTSRRAPELAVRTALGASRRRLVGQLFVEALTLGAVASVPGLVAAGAILAVYDRVLDELPFWIDLSLEPSTAVVVVALALLASAVTGLIPALRFTRGDTADSLRTPRGTSLGIGRIGGAMIVAEVALSVALLGTATLFGQGFRSYVNPAFDLPDERVLTARIQVDLDEDDLVEGGAATVGDSILTLTRSLQSALARLSGVRAVGVSSNPPRLSAYPEPVEIEGGPVVLTPVVHQGPGFFGVLEIAPTLGRDFDEGDLQTDAPPVVIVNEAFATRHFGTTQVLGRRLRLVPHEPGDEAPPWSEIVGVVPDVMEVTSAAEAGGVYHPFAPLRRFTVGLGVDRDPSALVGSVRRAAFDVDPYLTVIEVVRLDQVGAENRTALGVLSSALLGVGLVTLLLSLAGVYSIVSLAVSRRTKEIGVRVALGAEPGSILGTVLRRSATLVISGAVLGAVAGTALSRIRLFVFAVPEAEGWLFPLLVALMAGAAVAASWVPARRALAIEPVEALRREA